MAGEGRGEGGGGGVSAEQGREDEDGVSRVEYSEASAFREQRDELFHYEHINASRGEDPGHLLFPDSSSVSSETDGDVTWDEEGIRKLIQHNADVLGLELSPADWREIFPAPPLTAQGQGRASNSTSESAGVSSSTAAVTVTACNGSNVTSQSLGASNTTCAGEPQAACKVDAEQGSEGWGGGEEGRDEMSDAVRRDLWRIDPLLAQDEFVARWAVTVFFLCLSLYQLLSPTPLPPRTLPLGFLLQPPARINVSACLSHWNTYCCPEQDCRSTHSRKDCVHRRVR